MILIKAAVRGGSALGLALGVVVLYAACGDTTSDPGDGGVDTYDSAWPPERGSILPPESYDCRAAATPPERVASLPLGCFGDLDCEGLVVVAHRGVSYLAPQNTPSAVRAAIGLGVDLVEVDVRLTGDGVPVLMHNGDVEATTDGTGDVDTYTLAELQALHLVTSEDLVGDFSCERVPTLREVLTLARGRIDLMLDLKSGAAAAALVIEEENMIARAIMLGSESELTEARAAVPTLRIMVRPMSHDEVQPLWDAFVPPPHVVHIDPGFDDPITFDLIHSLGAKVLIDVWTHDAEAILLGDLTGYAEDYARGIDIQQSEWAFFPLWSVGRGSPP